MLDQFIARWINKPVDTDGLWPNQCMDLMHQYLHDVYGFSFFDFSAPSAKDVFLNFEHITGSSKFERIKYSPGLVPEPGDIVFWGTQVGEYGHVAIYKEGNSVMFVSFDSNWPKGSLPHLQNHSYNGVLGWLRFKKPNQNNMSENDTIASMLQGLVRGQFRKVDSPDVFSIMWVPDTHWQEDILKQDWNKIVELPPDWPIDPARWVEQRNYLQGDVDKAIVYANTIVKENTSLKQQLEDSKTLLNDLNAKLTACEQSKPVGKELNLEEIVRLLIKSIKNLM